MKCAALILFLVVVAVVSWFVTPVIAADTVTWNGNTFAQIRPTDAKGAVAEIFYHNEDVNNSAHDGDYSVDLGGFEVGIRFKWDARGGDDRITITPPDGYIAVPDTLTLPEGAEGLILIFPISALGV